MSRTSQNPLIGAIPAVLAIVACFSFLSTAMAQDADAAAKKLRRARSFEDLFQAGPEGVWQSVVEVEADGRQVGYGLITSADGQIVTKLSLLKNKLSCRLPNGKRFDAKLVFQDQENDLALLKVEAGRLKAASIPKNIKMQVGQWIISPSKSKSPLAVGVVGVLPKKILSASGFLGVTIEDGKGGAIVRQVAAASAAEACGLRVDDLITRIGKAAIGGRDELVEVVGALSPGDKVALQIVRNSRKVALTATLGKRDEPRTSQRRSRSRRFSRGFSTRRRGFKRAVQYDAVLQPSQCGGPVIDILGRVVGLNIARAERTRTLALTNDILLDFLMEAKKASN